MPTQMPRTGTCRRETSSSSAGRIPEACNKLHRVVERANPRQDKMRRPFEIFGARRHTRLNVQPFVNVGESLDVPQPVVDDG